MKQTICSVGDAILLEGFSESYDITSIREIVKKADVRPFNLENVLSDRPIFASSYCGGTWLLAKEDTLDDTLRFGFNGCSFANNHTMDFRKKYKMPYGLTAREQIAKRAKLGKGGLHTDVNNFRSLMPFMTFEDGKLTELMLYPLRLDMHTGLPALADEEETKIIYEYLCDRNKQFGTVININGKKIKVKLDD